MGNEIIYISLGMAAGYALTKIMEKEVVCPTLCPTPDINTTIQNVVKDIIVYVEDNIDGTRRNLPLTPIKGNGEQAYYMASQLLFDITLHTTAGWIHVEVARTGGSRFHIEYQNIEKLVLGPTYPKEGIEGLGLGWFKIIL